MALLALQAGFGRVRDQACTANSDQEKGMSRIEPHWGILPPEQKEIWPLLAGSAELGFVLYGGTAIALRLGHRTSIDFDFFSWAPFVPNLLMQKVNYLQNAVVQQSAPNTLTATID